MLLPCSHPWPCPCGCSRGVWSCLQDSLITTEARSGFPALSSTKCSSSSPWQELGMDPWLVWQAGVCAGLGLGEQTSEGNGAVFLSWVKCFGSDSSKCLPPRAQCGELGGRAACPTVRMGPGSWKGELCSNVFIYLVCPCPKGKQELLCVLKMFSRSSFSLLRDMCCPWCPFEEQSVGPFFVVLCLHGAEFLVETFPVLCPTLLASPGPRGQG